MLNVRFVIGSLLVTATVLYALAGCDQSPAPTPTNPKPAAPTAPLIEKKAMVDWCKEHGVPESVCTRCNADLIAGFQAKGDWCEKHGLPESQCVTCHPELEAKLKAMAPANGG